MTLGELLIRVYGETTYQEFKKEYADMIKNSNCQEDFKDKKFINIGLDFICNHLEEMINGKRKKQSIRALVCSSFGEAAIYKYNVCGGVINE